MTDDERFSMIISIGGATRFTGGVRDKRDPNNAPLTGGYTPGVPRLGVPALLSPDHAKPELVVAGALKLRPCRKRALPTSQAFGITEHPDWCNC